MAQTVLTYLIVAVAAAWVAWRVLLPARWQAHLRGLLRRDAPPPAGGCHCGRD